MEIDKRNVGIWIYKPILDFFALENFSFRLPGAYKRYDSRNCKYIYYVYDITKHHPFPKGFS